jgi:pimeloyl-ACP methyl ester carboxylesterase
MPRPAPSFTAVKSTNVRSTVLGVLGSALRGLERAAPPLAGALAEVLFRTPHRHRAPAREADWLAGSRPLGVRYDGETLPAWAWGEGPTVVLLHGWEGRAGQMGALAAGIAAAGFRAVAFDAPAHGGSRRRLASLPQFAGALRAAAGEVGGAHAVVAHSFGAAAASWAVAEGLAVERLVLLAPALDLDVYMTGFGRLLGVRRATVDRMVARIERRFGIDWSVARRPALAASRRAPGVEALVVHDEGDEETPWQGGAETARAFPRGRLLTTRGQGHRRLLRDPSVVAAVAGFVAGASAAEDQDAPAKRLALGA